MKIKTARKHTDGILHRQHGLEVVRDVFSAWMAKNGQPSYSRRGFWSVTKAFQWTEKLRGEKEGGGELF
jgi:hypothetical protein